MPNGSRKKFKVDVTDSNVGIDSTGLLAIPILSHEHKHNSDVVMDDILSDTESVDNVPLSDDTELDDNESLTFSFDNNDNYILDSSAWYRY